MCESSGHNTPSLPTPKDASKREQNIVGHLRAVRKGIENIERELGAIKYLVDGLEKAALS